MQTLVVPAAAPAPLAEPVLRPHPHPSGASVERPQDVRQGAGEEQGPPVEAGRGTSAAVWRVGSPSAGTSAVEFPDHPGLGGTLRYVDHYPMGSYEVTDHRGRQVTAETVAGGLDALTALADHYGLPLPVRAIPRPAGGGRARTASGRA